MSLTVYKFCSLLLAVKMNQTYCYCSIVGQTRFWALNDTYSSNATIKQTTLSCFYKLFLRVYKNKIKIAYKYMINYFYKLFQYLCKWLYYKINSNKVFLMHSLNIIYAENFRERKGSVAK